ncbi:MAG: hypothetical protein JSV65_00555 [Armatimonadota bacterium]|nr:MAG: hypothetical protein JSV65_00555 [Armatimonadota bacterium]
MVHEPAYALLIAVALALLLPEPGRWNPFALARSGARALASDLPRTGPWAAAAGVLVLVLIAGPAAAVTWLLTSELPVWLRLFAPDSSPVVALVLAAILLRLAFSLPPVWHRGAEERSAARLGAELLAPLMLYALIGIHAAVVYRAALEVAQASGGDPQHETLTAPASLVAYGVAAPARRLAMLLVLLASRGRADEAHPPPAPAVIGAIALAFLVTIW